MVEGDFMGENLLFNTESVTRYGWIKSKSNICQCCYLSRHHFDEINKLDREIMKKNIIDSPKYTALIKQIRKNEM